MPAGRNGGQRLALVVGYTITAAWGVSFGADLILPHYDPPASLGLSGLMLLVAGSCFSTELMKKRKGGNGR